VLYIDEPVLIVISLI